MGTSSSDEYRYLQTVQYADSSNLDRRRLTDFYSYLANDAFTGETKVSKDSGLFIARRHRPGP